MTLDFIPAYHPNRGDERLTLADAWRDQHSLDGPERRLLSAVILRAYRDVRDGNCHEDDALAYFAGENFAADCNLLGFNHEWLRPVIAMTTQIDLPDDQVRAIHARYLAQKQSLKEAAGENYVSASTLRRAFRRLNLPVRPSGSANRRAATEPAAGLSADALRELRGLIDDLDGRADVKVSIHIEIRDGEKR
jgi:hypothetical protein